MNDVIDAEVVEDEPAGALVHVAPAADMTLYGTDDPEAIIEKATAQAKALDRVVRERNLITNIRGNEHVRVEGWTTLGALVGVFPVTAWTKRLVDDRGNFEGFEARVEAHTRDGSIVGAAEARCTRWEDNWAKRDEYALQSMAQTRATSKALRMPLGFIVELAGFNPTPAEEMPRDEYREPSPQRQERQPRPDSRQRAARQSAAQSQRQEGGGGASEGQKKMMFAVSKKIGLDTDEDRYGFYSNVTGRSITSVDDLDGPQRGSEANQVCDALKAVELGEASLAYNDVGPYPEYGQRPNSGNYGDYEHDGRDYPPDQEPF